jgi:hypothetical protein
MYILTREGKEDEGAYSVRNEVGDNILYIFKEKDDAVRFAMMLEEDGSSEMSVMEVEPEMIIPACQVNGYEYIIFTSDDIVIPPKTVKNDYI